MTSQGSAHGLQAWGSGVGRTAQQARRTLSVPARHPPADPGRAAQSAAASDRALASLRVSDGTSAARTSEAANGAASRSHPTAAATRGSTQAGASAPQRVPRRAS